MTPEVSAAVLDGAEVRIIGQIQRCPSKTADNYTLSWHPSQCANTSFPIPANVQPETLLTTVKNTKENKELLVRCMNDYDGLDEKFKYMRSASPRKQRSCRSKSLPTKTAQSISTVVGSPEAAVAQLRTLPGTNDSRIRNTGLVPGTYHVLLTKIIFA